MVIFRNNWDGTQFSKSRGFCVPKCSVDFRRHQTSLDIDIAAHYIFYITCALLSGTFLCRFVSNNKTNCIKNKLYNLNK
jgi:hypothetical protein